MAYRRRQGLSRASTFKEEFHHHLQPSSSDSIEKNNTVGINESSHPDPAAAAAAAPALSSSSSLAAQAIKASAGRRDPSLSFSFSQSYSFASDHRRSKSFETCGDSFGKGGSNKSGFWGVLAQKAKEILEEDNSSSPHQRDINMPDRLRSHSSITAARAQEFKTGDQQRLHHHQMKKLNGSFQENSSSNKNHQTSSGKWNNPWQQQSAAGQTVNPQTIHETQLKASRDVAMATAAKAKLLLRELKTVKADLAFAKARCAQLEEENKLLRDREGRNKGHNRADDDLIRLQLETLLAEKARLANENEIYSRENRFLREIVEYHQLSMQDVVYLDDDEGMEEVAELYPPIDSTTGMRLSMSTHPPLGGGGRSRGLAQSSLFPLPQEQEEQDEQDHQDKNNTSEDEAPPANISTSKDDHAK